MHGSEHVWRRQALTDFRSHSNRWIWVRLCERVWVWERGAVCACAVDNTCKCACVWMRSQYNQVAQAALPVQKLIFSGTRVQSVKRTRYKTKVNKSNKNCDHRWIFKNRFCDICRVVFLDQDWMKYWVFYLCTSISAVRSCYSAAVAMSRRCFNSSYLKIFVQ